MAKKTDKQPKKQSENTVYIGKTAKGIAQYTVFPNGVIPENIARLIDGDETIKNLIVPVSQLQQARHDVKVKGTILNLYYNKQKKQ